jgi:hypothetical protein
MGTSQQSQKRAREASGGEEDAGEDEVSAGQQQQSMPPPLPVPHPPQSQQQQQLLQRVDQEQEEKLLPRALQNLPQVIMACVDPDIQQLPSDVHLAVLNQPRRFQLLRHILRMKSGAGSTVVQHRGSEYYSSLCKLLGALLDGVDKLTDIPDDIWAALGPPLPVLVPAAVPMAFSVSGTAVWRDQPSTLLQMFNTFGLVVCTHGVKISDEHAAAAVALDTTPTYTTWFRSQRNSVVPYGDGLRRQHTLTGSGGGDGGSPRAVVAALEQSLQKVVARVISILAGSPVALQPAAILTNHEVCEFVCLYLFRGWAAKSDGRLCTPKMS